MDNNEAIDKKSAGVTSEAGQAPGGGGAEGVLEQTADRPSSGREIAAIILRVLCAFIFIFLLSAAFVFGKSLFMKNVYTVAKKVNEVVNIMPAKDRYVFLLLGTDKLIDVNRTDTMIIAVLSIAEKRLDIVSLPRDTKIDMPGHGAQKINAVFTFEYVRHKNQGDAIKNTRKYVEKYCDIPIDYYVKVDLDGFEKIIDLIGGVEIDVEKNMTYDDNKQNLHIRLKKGLQVLDGKNALHYCRFRHDRLGDLGRMQRQQKFLRAVIDRFKDGKTLIRLPDIVSGSLRFVSTDVDMPLLMSLFAAIPEPSKLSFKTHMVPGDYGYIDNICYFLTETGKFIKMMNYIKTGDFTKLDEPRQTSEVSLGKKADAQQAPKKKAAAARDRAGAGQAARAPQGKKAGTNGGRENVVINVGAPAAKTAPGSVEYSVESGETNVEPEAGAVEDDSTAPDGAALPPDDESADGEMPVPLPVSERAAATGAGAGTNEAETGR